MIRISNEDWGLLLKHSYCLDSGGYPCTRIKGRTYRLHKQIADRMGLKGEIDHINNDREDCRRENLRLATRSENNYNRSPNHNSVSGFKGVTFDNQRNRYVARIHYKGKQIHLGRFETAENAAIAYNNAAMKYFGKFANLNIL